MISASRCDKALIYENGPSHRDRLKNSNPWRELGSELPIREPDVLLGLQVQPEPGLHGEEHSKPKRGVRSDGALAIHHLADPAGPYIDVRRELSRTDAHGLHEIFQLNLARMNLFK